MDRAHVPLVGDWAQLSAVDSGGAIAMHMRSLDKAPELGDVRRFRHPWEKTATIQLRVSETAALDAQNSHERVRAARASR